MLPPISTTLLRPASSLIILILIACLDGDLDLLPFLIVIIRIVLVIHLLLELASELLIIESRILVMVHDIETANIIRKFLHFLLFFLRFKRPVDLLIFLGNAFIFQPLVLSIQGSSLITVQIFFL